MTFVCNICGTRSEAEPAQLDRDLARCSGCRSNPRRRAVLLVLSTTLFGRSMSLSEFPSRPDLTGIGLTDVGYASGLAAKLGYTNTYYDREPRLDITDPPEELHGTLDFLISSDVFEHVCPPVERAFEGCFRLLKPGGLLVLTVPHSHEQRKTQEHFPSLHECRVVDFNGSRILVNKTADGRWEVFDEVRFHDGEGFTVEMRRFATSSLLNQLRGAGFEDITEWTDDYPEHGIVGWKYGFPITAQAARQHTYN